MHDSEASSSGSAAFTDINPVKSVHFKHDNDGRRQESPCSGSNAISGDTDVNTEAKTSPKYTNTDNRSANVINGEVEATAMKSTVKGTCAKFLRQNPRFINEPICQVLPNESSRSVGDCLRWQTTSKSNTMSTVTNGRADDSQRKFSEVHSDKL